MMPTVHTRLRNLPVWRHGSYWGCGEGIEWTLLQPNPISFMIRSERMFFDCNHYAIRICFLFFSFYAEVNMPWYVKNRMFFFSWYPYMCRSDWRMFQLQVISRFTCYVKLETRVHGFSSRRNKRYQSCP